MRGRWPVLLWVAAGAYLAWWVARDPFPDGFQNEYLHVGNAFDLWRALLERDWWTLRWVAYTNYWPFGFLVAPWPLLAVLGQTRAALVAANMGHLAVLLWAAHRLGRRLGAPLAPLLVLLAPGVFGPLVRFEPNLAAEAWTLAGLAFLVDSDGLRRRGPALGFGAALGVGLMMDRVTVALFLGPAALAWAGALRDRVARRNAALALLVALLVCASWYREFLLRHLDEVLSQAPVGEIDSAGAVSVGPSSPAWYVLALLDSQAGPVLGAAMLVGLLAALAALARRDGPPATRRALLGLVLAVVPAGLLFTLVAKKQVFYTLPALGPLAVLAARRRRLAPLAAAGGLWAFLDAGLGVVPDGFPGSPWMPEERVAPRHTLARPPTGWTPRARALREALDAVEAACPERRATVAVFSQDDELYEGFVVLALRERLPRARVRGVVIDPVGTYESMRTTDDLLSVRAAGAGWPGREAVLRELLADHYRVDELPPVADEVERAGGDFEARGRWVAGTVGITWYHRRGAPDCGRPEL